MNYLLFILFTLLFTLGTVNYFHLDKNYWLILCVFLPCYSGYKVVIKNSDLLVDNFGDNILHLVDNVHNLVNHILNQINNILKGITSCLINYKLTLLILIIIFAILLLSNGLLSWYKNRI